MEEESELIILSQNDRTHQHPVYMSEDRKHIICTADSASCPDFNNVCGVKDQWWSCVKVAMYCCGLSDGHDHENVSVILEFTCEC